MKSLAPLLIALMTLGTAANAQNEALRTPAGDEAANRDDSAAALASGNREFAFALYEAICRGREPENVCISPYSISAALAMTVAGAAGDTERQMLETLRIGTLDDVHAAFAALDVRLRQSGPRQPEDSGSPPVLRIANRIWPARREKFLDSYTALLRERYGAELEPLNFRDAGAAAARINAWIADQTEQRIKDLLTPDMVREASLVLTNAVYFKGSWLRAFQKEATHPGQFTRLDGKAIEVPMMQILESLQYTRRDGLQAVALPYVGQRWSMVLLVPDEGQFSEMERGLKAETFRKMLSAMEPQQVRLALPRWTFRSRFSLPPVLRSLGMQAAFDASQADFSRMDGTRELFISEVVHEAFIAVDEAGTEAAAATAVVMMRTSIDPQRPVELRIDRPFLFAICERETGTVLFLGRVMDPTAG
jgi:serpin B